jgi:hypothetical protein
VISSARASHRDAFRDRVDDVVAVAELQLQILALHRGAIADAGDLSVFGEALGHAGDQVLHQRALHAPDGTRARFVSLARLRPNLAVLDRVT